MKKFVFILLIALTTVAFTAKHKFFVSVTQIDYIQEEQSIQIISKIFIDDIERLIRERYDETITLSDIKEPKIVNYYLDRYLKEKLSITINGKPEIINFIGKDYEDDIMVCYLEIEGIPIIETIEIQNTMLFNLFEDQQNIVRTKINGKNKSFILIKENNKGMLNFK